MAGQPGLKRLHTISLFRQKMQHLQDICVTGSHASAMNQSADCSAALTQALLRQCCCCHQGSRAYTASVAYATAKTSDVAATQLYRVLIWHQASKPTIQHEVSSWSACTAIKSFAVHTAVLQLEYKPAGAEKLLGSIHVVACASVDAKKLIHNACIHIHLADCHCISGHDMLCLLLDTDIK